MDMLIQKYLLKEITFEIKNDCIHYKSKEMLNSIECDFSFEEISDKVIYQTKIQDTIKIFIVCCLVFVIAA